jgi:hypothetical protein
MTITSVVAREGGRSSANQATAIERHVGAKLSREDVSKLGDSLAKLV